MWRLRSRSRRPWLSGGAALVFLVASLTFPALASAQQTLSGSVSLSTNATNATGVQDTVIAQQTSGTAVSIAGGDVVLTLPSNQSVPSSWSTSDVTTLNIPSPGTITQSGNTITIPFTGTLSSSTQITVVITGLANGGTAGSAAATVDEDTSSGTVEATGSFSDSLVSTVVQAVVTVAEAMNITAEGQSVVRFSVSPTFGASGTLVGGLTVQSNAVSTAISVAATTATDSATGATLPWTTNTPGLTFTPVLNYAWQSAEALSTTPTVLITVGPTAQTIVYGNVEAQVNWSQPAGVYTTTLTYTVSPTY